MNFNAGLRRSAALPAARGTCLAWTGSISRGNDSKCNPNPVAAARSNRHAVDCVTRITYKRRIIPSCARDRDSKRRIERSARRSGPCALVASGGSCNSTLRVATRGGAGHCAAPRWDSIAPADQWVELAVPLSRVPGVGIARLIGLARRYRDGVEERTSDAAAPPAGRSERTALAIGEVVERLVVSGRDQRSVVEFVAAQNGIGGAHRAVAAQPRLAIAEMQLTRSEARGMTEQTGHGAANAVRVFQAFAQHHVAAALAM